MREGGGDGPEAMRHEYNAEKQELMGVGEDVGDRHGGLWGSRGGVGGGGGVEGERCLV